MDERPAERKLAAILSADVEGYSRLMGEDELGTVRALTEYREVISAAVARHGGRVVDSPGDNVLADFVSVVDAVQCAVNIQRALQSRNADLPPPRQMRFRIGINLGDVIVQGERLYGDGVNIAARLEGLAGGGDICLSGTAYDQIEGKLPFAFEFSGEHTVKNIARPVRVYRLHLEPRAFPKRSSTLGGVDRRASVRVAAILAIVMLLGAGGWAGWRWFRPSESAGLALPDKPSVAVLPFANLSQDPAQEYFSDGVTEDLITGLSKMSGLFVIARNSVFTYKGKPVNVRDVGRDLGVRYVLEGGVQRAGNRVRITAQLVDARSGYHLWAERAIALDNTLADGYRLLAQTSLWQKQHERAIAEAQRSVELGPNDASAYETLAEILCWSGRPEESIRLIRHAMRLDPHYPFFYLWTLGHAYFLTEKRQEALDTFAKLVQQNPNFVPAHAYRAVLLSELGRMQEAQQAWEQASRISPGASMANIRERLPYKRPADLDRVLSAAHRAGVQ